MKTRRYFVGHDASDIMLEIPRGRVPGQSAVNKFGRNTDIDTAADEDIHDGGGIWTAPTQARTHDIASTDVGDTSAGAGAQTIRVYGLTDWDTAEVSEDITMNGLTNVPTVNQYVIMHRMKALAWGVSGPNIGVITATAQTDGTVTAQIGAGNGQTLMAIYGIPSTQTAYATSYFAGIARSISTSIDSYLLYNPIPDVQLTGFLIKHVVPANSTGVTDVQHSFAPYKEFEGPGILKVQCGVGANNSDVTAGFDLILVDN